MAYIHVIVKDPRMRGSRSIATTHAQLTTRGFIERDAKIGILVLTEQGRAFIATARGES